MHRTHLAFIVPGTLQTRKSQGEKDHILQGFSHQIKSLGSLSLRFTLSVMSIIISAQKILSLNCLLVAIFLKTVFVWQLLQGSFVFCDYLSLQQLSGPPRTLFT